MSERELAVLLRQLLEAYRERFHVVAPRVDPPVPMLAQKRLDVVALNGGQALHFFFSDPSPSTLRSGSGHTRLHHVTMWPADTLELRALVRKDPGAHRDQVRKTARIRGDLYVHFVLFPEDGNLEDVVRVVGARLADREVAWAAGEDLEEEVPAEAVDEAALLDATEDRRARPWDPGLDPAP